MWANNQEMCLGCHQREASIQKIDKAAKQEDVHFVGEMEYMEMAQNINP
jgi:nitrate reductase cytochrome c-type subunit